MISRSSRYVLLLALLGTAALPAWSSANTTLSRQEIRQMPITERPSRPGHFYGNTVRRLHHRRGGR
jgi:hypothetical protein